MLSETSTVAVAADVPAVPAMGSQKHYMKLMPDPKPGPMKLLFAGWNGETGVAVALAQSMAPAGSEITVLSDDAHLAAHGAQNSSPAGTASCGSCASSRPRTSTWSARRCTPWTLS